MNAARANRTQTISLDSTMRGALMMSAMLHAGIFLFAAFGLPFVATPPPLPSPPISVELVQIDEMTATPRSAPPAKPEEKKPDLMEPPPPAPAKPEPPTMTEAAPPDLITPAPPDKKPEPQAAEAAQPPPVPSAKPKPPEKKPPTEKPEANKKPAEAQSQNFQSLLRNLMPQEQTPAQAGEASDSRPTESQIAPPGQTMTVSEEDALRRQLGRCWNVLAGGKYAEDLVVEIRVQINPDRTVRHAAIMDQGRYNRDTHFRAAADSALRALRNPLCTPLALPPGKYEQWKTTTIRFNPRDML